MLSVGPLILIRGPYLRFVSRNLWYVFPTFGFCRKNLWSVLRTFGLRPKTFGRDALPLGDLYRTLRTAKVR